MVLWLARFLLIASGFTVAFAVQHANILGALFGWAMAVISPVVMMHALREDV